MTNTILSLQEISKTFQTKEREFTVLKKVNLTIDKGEYFAIVGKSGSGKSTLLNMVKGIDHCLGFFITLIVTLLFGW